MASSLSLHAMCQIAIPGTVAVGYPALAARRANSQSSHLMNSGIGRPIFSAHSRGIMHPPAVALDVDAPVQVLGVVAVPQRVFREVVVVFGERRRRPHEGVPVDGLTHAVQVAAVLQVEHLTADQHGDLANRDSARARRIESGSMAMSSSMYSTYGLSVRRSASYMMRA